jgi:hypothetical protein
LFNENQQFAASSDVDLLGLDTQKHNMFLSVIAVTGIYHGNIQSFGRALGTFKSQNYEN